MSTLVSIAQLPAARRENAWRDAVCNAFVRLECTMDRRAPLHGRLEAGAFGDLQVARVTGSPQRVERTAARAGQDAAPLVLVSVQLRGRTVVEQGASQAVLTPGCLAFYDTARPYTLTLPGEFDQIVLQLPRDTVAREAPRALQRMAQRVPAGNPFAQAMLALAPQLLRMDSAARPELARRTAAAATELFALALESLDSAAAASDVPRAAFEPASRLSADALVWRAREVIGQQLDDTDLHPARLAVQMRVSLRRLQEVFQQHGTTVTESIWDARLEFARGLLASATHAHDSVSTLAYQAGFADVAHFSRRFKQRYGTSPSQYRAGSLH